MKMKKVRNSILLLLIFLGIIGICDMVVQAETNKDYPGYQYKILDDGTVEIYNYVSDYSKKELNIPSEIDGKKVTSINGFGEISVESVIIPEGVTSISGFTYSSLSHIVVPTSIKKIDGFYECNNLYYINYNGTKEQWKSVEVSGEKLAELEIHCTDGIANKQNQTEDYKYSIKEDGSAEITKYIGKSKSPTIPLDVEGISVTSIGEKAFQYKGITTITIQENVTHISEDAFVNCTWLSSIKYLGTKTQWQAIGYTATNTYNVLEICCKDATINEKKTEDDYEYIACEDGTVEITKCISENTEIEIPSELDGKVVTGIRRRAFNSCGKGDPEINTVVIIPKSIKRIESYAFEHSGIKIAKILGDVEQIKEYTFSHSSLKEITLPENLKSINSYAFFNCSSLTSITIPEGLTNIGFSVFEGCSSLKSVVLPKSLEELGSFGNCESLNYVIYNGTKEQWNSSFYNKFSNTIEIRCTDGIVNLQRDYDYIVRNDGKIEITKCLKNVEELSIPLELDDMEVVSIGSLAFSDCSNLKKITIPNNIVSIGSKAFYNCKNLTSVVYLGTMEEWQEISIDKENEPLLKTEIHCTNGITNEKTYNYIVKSDGTIEITEYVGQPINIIIPSQIDGKPVTSIGTEAFSGCKSLKRVELQNGIKSIGSSAFAYCTNLKKVIIPKSVTDIISWAFNSCNKSLSITYAGTKAQWKTLASKWGENEELLKKIEVWCTDGTINEKLHTEDFEITVQKNNTVTIIKYIGDSENLTIPSKINGKAVSIESEAFKDCSTLKNIVISTGITFIPLSAFENCANLEKVTMPNSVKWIDGYAFKNCKKLNQIEFSTKLTSIGNSIIDGTAYYNNSKNWQGGDIKLLYLSDYLIKAKNASIVKNGSVTIKAGTRIIADEAFFNNKKLTKITMPASVQYVGMWAFGEGRESCSNLKEAIYGGTKEKWKEFADWDGNGCLKKIKAKCADGTIGNYNCNHSYKSVKITKNTTYTESGSRTLTCSKCDETQIETIPRLNSTTTLKTLTTGNKSVKVTWGKVANVTGYQLQIATNKEFTVNKKNITIDAPNTTSKSITGLKANQKYYARIRSYKTIGTSKKYGSWSAVKSTTTPVQKPKATILNTVKSYTKSIGLTWKKIDKVDGYQILLATNSNFTKNKKTVTITKKSTITKKVTALKAKTKYYVKIRTYDIQTVNGKKINVYSDWSKAKSVTTK